MKIDERAPEARLREVLGDVDLSNARPIKITRNTGLLCAGSNFLGAAKILPDIRWSHSISVTLASSPQSDLIAVLRTKALDADQRRIFDRPTIPADGLAALLRLAANCASDERFESIIFEAFQLASRRSMDHAAAKPFTAYAASQAFHRTGVPPRSDLGTHGVRNRPIDVCLSAAVQRSDRGDAACLSPAMPDSKGTGAAVRSWRERWCRRNCRRLYRSSTLCSDVQEIDGDDADAIPRCKRAWIKLPTLALESP